MRDIGLTASETALINAAAGVVTILGPVIFGPLAHRYKKYTLLISITLLLSTLCFTALLFVPRVVRTPRHPQLLFDCTNGYLMIEQCQDWQGNCNVHAKRLATGNFTNFTFYQCRHHCTNGSISEPIEVCFQDSTEKPYCMNPQNNIQRTSTTPSSLSSSVSSSSSSSSFSDSLSSTLLDFKPLEPIQFDSRFDRWPLVETRSNVYGSTPFCLFQPNEALIIKSETYQSISCRPTHPSCTIQCRVDMIHRAHSVMTSPLPCFRMTGNQMLTFWSYLVARCMADFCLFTGFALIDALAITLTNDFDAIYGRASKTISIAFPLMLWPAGVGFLVDYFSTITSRPDYSPIFVIYNGLILITIIMLICFPVTPIIDSNPVPYSSLSSTSLTAITASMNSISKHSKSGKEKSKTRWTSKHLVSEDEQPKMSLKNKIILTSLIPFVMVLGSVWDYCMFTCQLSTSN